ncbi:MAG: hypothetical protein RLZZ187_2158 [Pseudomonadota bacterium]|jgi:hypothetical protein
MSLGIPSLVGPVSAWSRSILVERALTGANVTIRRDGPAGQILAQGPALGSLFRLSLLPAAALLPGTRLFVVQELGPDASDWTSPHLALPVGVVPSDHKEAPPVTVTVPVFECGIAVWVESAIPGAEVIVSAGGQELGRGTAHENGARLRLMKPIPQGVGEIEIVQMAPAGATALTGIPTPVPVPVMPLPVPERAPLPKLEFGDPLPAGCRPGFLVAGALEGAEVTVTRLATGATETRAFDRASLVFLLDKRLDPDGERIAVSQAMPERCSGRAPSPPADYDVPPAGAPAAPKPRAPCGGATWLVVEDIEPDAKVSIEFDGRGFNSQAAPAGTRQRFELPPMPAGATVKVVQQACGRTSAAGETTVGTGQPGSRPEVVGPLFQCARAVRIKGATPGALLRIVASTPSGELPLTGLLDVDAETMQVTLNIHLVAGWGVYAEQVACGGAPVTSAAWTNVEPTPPILSVRITEALFAGQQRVRVDAIPGAFVEILVGGGGSAKVIGRGHVDPGSDLVWLERPLAEGEWVYAVQHMCRERTREGERQRVNAGEKVFTLPKKETWPITSEAYGKDVVWESGKLTCRWDGSWTFDATIENKATKSWVSVDADVVVSPPGFTKFRVRQSFDLAAADNPNDPNNAYFIQLGNTPKQSRSLVGFDPQMEAPAYFLAVLIGTAKFEWDVRVKNLPSSKPDASKEWKEQTKPKAVDPPSTPPP